ncbi:sensor histidine kinase [Vallitalea pronyensis]|uniref:histidine kinase n=1 Tax=Vallitalea pronyensis TaxID=1348613 RepID=A0A8J8MPJ4_9FIRM|nr:sensor histidine kinase [Vallitalea pronyensis]QUI25192.1 sensor histidine kinase [Vallitalea pronyensis]
MLNRKYWVYYFMHIPTIIIFYFAFSYEDARGSRYSLLLILFGVFILLSILQKFCKTKVTIFMLLMLKVVMIALIELNSKFAINYFIHALYLSVMIESTFFLTLRKVLMIGGLVFIASMYKFVSVLMINPSFSNMSQMFLFALINILVMVVMGFAKYHKEEEKKVHELYHKLLEAHKQLQHYADRIKALTVVEERNRIARDLHDTLGHDLTGLIMQLEMTSTMLEDDVDAAKTLMEQSKHTSRESLKKVRQIVHTFKEAHKVDRNLDEIHGLVQDFASKTGAAINLHITGEKITLLPEVYITLYRIIQEAMTNAIRHGKADMIHIRIHLDDKKLTFHIEDNGRGCKLLEEGYGLQGMRERVALLGGTLSYTHKKGFVIDGTLLLEVYQETKMINP